MLTSFNIEKVYGLSNKVMCLLSIKSFQLYASGNIYKIECLQGTFTWPLPNGSICGQENRNPMPSISLFHGKVYENVT